MATSRVFQDLISGVTDADPGAAGLTLSGPFLADLAVVASPEFIALTLDPEEVFGNAEVVHVTVHTASATTATIERGKEGTTGIAHAVGTKGIASPTAAGVSELIPVGSMTLYGGATAPANYALCDGASLDTTAYASLFAVIGYVYGGSGANFNIPDMIRRWPLGAGTTAASERSGTSNPGDNGGNINHKHTGPAHIHTMSTHSHTMNTHIHTMGTHKHEMSVHIHTISNTGPAIPGADTGSQGLFEGAGVKDQHTHTSANANAIDPGDTLFTDPGDTNTTDPGDTNTTDPGDTNSAGTGETSQNNPSYLVVNYIIKVV